MRKCAVCSGKIEDGVIHSCSGPPYHAPWLKECFDGVHSELSKIRALLEAQAGKGATQAQAGPVLPPNIKRREMR